ncbi:MAG: DUF3000 domain-containing protein [Actinomycetota bacterium]|nr:MAG: DUF3000 domain-containing protein [Actinomycetota bacterium]
MTYPQGPDARPSADPDAPLSFRTALASLGTVRYRDEIDVHEAPAPHRLAPYAVALVAEIVDDDEEVASGRLVVLHDPAGHEAWDGTFRVVAFVRARLEPEMASDPLLPDVGWTWVRESLDSAVADERVLGGTVTRTSSVSFGAMAERPVEGQIEIRASWTPAGPDLAPHAQAWADLLATAAGLPPVPQGVASLPGPRRR